MYLTDDQLNEFIDDFKSLSSLDKQNMLGVIKHSYDNLTESYNLINDDLAKARNVREQLAPDDIGEIDEMDETIDEFEAELDRLTNGLARTLEKIVIMGTIIALEQKETK